MSLKTDIEMVKEELSSEEKFFETAVVTEKFVKKYKNVMIGGVGAVVLFVAADIGYTLNKKSTLASANAALSELQASPHNPATLARLQNLSPVLGDVWSYSQAVVSKNASELKKLQDSKALLVGDLASYELAQSTNDAKLLETYANSETAMYKDLARMQKAVILINEKKIDAAHEELNMIGLNSPLAKVAKALMHYGVK